MRTRVYVRAAGADALVPKKPPTVKTRRKTHRPKSVERVATEENRGRPLSGKLTPEVVTEILAYYSAGLTLTASCHRANVSSVAFHYYRHRNPDFDTSPEWLAAHFANTAVLEERAHDLALTADARSPTMLIFLLKARLPHKYRDNVAVHHSATDGFVGAFAEAMRRVNGGGSTTAEDRSSAEVH